MRRYLSDYFTNVHKSADIFIYPASNMSAPLIGKSYEPSYMDYILTNSNLTGNPSLTLKLGIDKIIIFHLIWQLTEKYIKIARC